MRTVILGATGFVGRELVLGLQRRGHQVSVLARSPARARTVLPAGVDVADVTDDAELAAAVARADVVVNLAGESIAGKRWTRRRKQLLTASRIAVTERLVAAIAARSSPLPLLISASATGYYGDRGDSALADDSGPGIGFAAELCRAWEAAASRARAARIVHTRFGIVLGREGGALRPLLRLTRFGLGGPIGGGAQWVPWIHIDDVVAALAWIIDDPRLVGPVAVTAPGPVRQRELAQTLGRVLDRPAVLPTPRAALAIALGEAAALVLASQRVVPRALLAAGFAFQFADLDAAIEDLVADAVAIAPAHAASLPATEYVRARRPRYTLHTTTELAAPLADVFAFFASPENLAALSPPGLAFEIVGAPADLEHGAVIDYKIRVAGIPMRWRTRIERWQPAAVFVDSQERGPYRAWWHEHRFSERDGKTIMDDVVHYAPPLGPLGTIANRLVIGPMLRRIFSYRQHVIRTRFGVSA